MCFAGPRYMAALAFSVYGIHWFAIGWNRMHQADPRPNGFMAIALLLISILGVTVFWMGGDWPVALIFAGLMAVYIFAIFLRVSGCSCRRASACWGFRTW